MLHISVPIVIDRMTAFYTKTLYQLQSAKLVNPVRWSHMCATEQPATAGQVNCRL